MSWIYDPSLSTDKDRARFYIGDTDQEDILLSDEEITALLEVEGSPLRAAIVALEHLAAKFSRQVDTNNTGLALSASQRAQAFAQRAQELRNRLPQEIPIAGMFVGGACKEPAFRRSQDDY
jgi:hypothetical protein